MSLPGADAIADTTDLCLYAQRQAEVDYYPPATLEGSTSSTTSAVSYEQNFYSINSDYIVPIAGVTALPAYLNNNNTYDYTSTSNLYPAGNSGNTNATVASGNVYVINGSSNKMGLAITLKVMAGDKLTISGKSYYFTNNQNDNSSYNLPVLTLLTGFLGAPGAAALPGAADAGVNAAGLDNISGLVTNVGSYLTTSAGGITRTPTTSTKPRAYLNWVFFDDQMNYAGGGFQAVGANGTLQDYYTLSNLQGITAPKSGYVYVYCSNESPVNVYFDNIQVVQTRGPLIEENHYYPFGLTMAAISDKAVKNQYPENKNRYDGGNELQNKEFSDGSGLELYETYFRSLDPQLGRFWQQDPMADAYAHESPYAYCSDNPVGYFDPMGSDETVDVAQAIVDLWNAGGGEWTANSSGDGKGYAHPFASEDEALTTILGNKYIDGELGEGEEAMEKFQKIVERYNELTNGHLKIPLPVIVTGKLWNYVGWSPVIIITNEEDVEKQLAANGAYEVGDELERAEKFSNREKASEWGEKYVGFLGKLHDFKWGINETSEVFESVGHTLTVVNALTSVYEGAFSKKGWQIHNTIDIVADGISLIPGVGEVFGTVWFVSNLVSEISTGKSLSEHIEHAFRTN